MTTTTTLTQARRRAVLTSITGNALEFYDTTIYAFFAIYFADHFFPSSDKLVSQISAYAVFGLSFFVRPLGGILVSIYADKIGRKPIIVALTLIMASTTGLIGFLPTYAQAGLLAPILLIILRLVQAIAVGGVFSSTTAFLMEFAPPEKRGFYASMQMLAQAIAPIFANLVALVLLYTIGKEKVTEFGWRVPFLLGFLTAPLGFYIHKFVDESPDFSDYIKRAQNRSKQACALQLSIAQTLKQSVYVAQILRCTALIMVGTVSYYGVAIYLPGFIKDSLRLDDIQHFLISLATPTCTVFGILFSGWWCDRTSRKKAMLLGITLYGFVFFTFFFFLFRGCVNYQWAVVGMSIIGFCMGLHWGVLPVMTSESYPVQIRASAMSIAYNGAVVLFGAMMPTYMKLLEKVFGSNPTNPLVYIGMSIIISFIATLLWRPASALKIANE